MKGLKCYLSRFPVPHLATQQQSLMHLFEDLLGLLGTQSENYCVQILALTLTGHVPLDNDKATVSLR